MTATAAVVVESRRTYRVVFFFQAEDGIRDYKVTGVQTCALPIFGAYGATNLLHGSGFLATYVSALVLGNARLPHRPATRGFAEGIAWLAQIGLDRKSVV